MGVAVFGEGLLAGIAAFWIWSRGLPVEVGDPLVALSVGLTAAAAMSLANYGLLRMVPPVRPVRAIRRLYVEKFRPLFAAATPVEILVVSLAAGIGEELLFRGAVQAEFGLVVASVCFGLAHIGGRVWFVFGFWVVVMGLGLGGLTVVTGGLGASIVSHVVYDAAAITYIHREAAIACARRP